MAKKLLSICLIICLITGSVSPALAQLRPVGQGVKAVRQAGKAVPAAQMTQRTAGEFSKYAAGMAPFRAQPLPSSFSSSQIQAVVSQQVAARQLTVPADVQQIQARVRAGHLDGVAAAIINLPAAAAQKPALLRNEFVTAALAGKASPEQLARAIKFYHIDLVQRASLLADIPQQPLSSLLQQTPAQTLQVYREILSSAAALAALGSKEDVPALLAFWEQASQGPFKAVAAAITGRGLLRFEAYAHFNVWANTMWTQGELWMGFDAYATAHDLPIVFLPRPGVSLVPEEKLAAWLREGCAVNVLNAHASLQATEQWLALGKDPALLARLTTKPAPAPKASQAAPQSAQKPLPKVPQIPALPPIQTASLSVFLPQVEKLSLPTDDKLTKGPAAATAIQTPAVPQPVSRAAVDNSGMLYSGIPLFAWGKSLIKLGNRIRAWKPFSRHTRSSRAFNEDPSLHENTVQEIFESPQEQNVTDPDDLVDLDIDNERVLVGEHGFKLTVETADGTEQILRNVDVEIDAPIKTNGYNRLVLSNGHIFQLRNLTQKPSNLEYFYFELPHQNGELWQLLSVSPQGLGLSRPLRIKLERVPNRRYSITSLRAAVEGVQQSVPVIADVDATLLPAQKSGSLLIKQNGTVAFVPDQEAPVLLKDFYVRLPKQESKYWAPLMQAQPESKFSLQIHPTAKKTNVLTMNVPLLQIGLGKTLSPELKARTTLGESTSSTIMLSINNVLPVMMGFVHPLLRRYGEATVLRWGTGFFVAGGAVALGSGLYGFLGDGVMSSWQLTGFLTSSVLIAMGTNVTRFVQNLLITSNRGKIVPKDSFSVKDEETTQGPPPVYNLQYLGHRAKEVFTHKPTSSARDVVLFQTGQMFKNIGTMAFLAAPWLTNAAAKGLFGVDLGLDFSASYVPYAAFSAWTSYKLSRTAFKDAVPTNLSAVENNFQETLSGVMGDLKNKSRQVLRPGQPEILDAAKKLKSAIEILARAESRYQKVSFKKSLLQHEEECVEELRAQLSAQGRSAVTIHSATGGLQEAFDSLGHRNVRLGTVLFSPKMFPATIGMTLATMHELSVSNGFAFTMHNLLPNGAHANALTALVLYGSMSTGRLLGNWISRRISGGSMYALSSLFSLTGTATMVASGGNVPLLMTGAVVASFGVGNFFSQMYEYMTGLYPKFRREISLIINYTMPAAAMLSMPMRKLVGVTGFAGMDLLVSGVGLLGSLALTPGMFANSSIVLAGKYGLGQLKQYVKNVFHKKKTPPSGLDEAATAP